MVMLQMGAAGLCIWQSCNHALMQMGVGFGTSCCSISLEQCWCQCIRARSIMLCLAQTKLYVLVLWCKNAVHGTRLSWLVTCIQQCNAVCHTDCAIVPSLLHCRVHVPVQHAISATKACNREHAIYLCQAFRATGPVSFDVPGLPDAFCTQCNSSHGIGHSLQNHTAML